MRMEMRNEQAMSIRPAAVEDSRMLAAIQVDSYRSSYADLLPSEYLDHFAHEEQEEDWRILLASPSEQVLLVAEGVGTGVVGYVLSGPAADGGSNYDAELLALHVRRAHHRRGIGRQLVAAAAMELNVRGGLSLCLWVLEQTSARLFYDKLGGQLAGRRAWENNGYFGTNVVEVQYTWRDIAPLCQPGARFTPQSNMVCPSGLPHVEPNRATD